MDAMLHSIQSRLIFPSWTSRVRSPSPAFPFIGLRACGFSKYSIYSVKGVVRDITSARTGGTLYDRIWPQRAGEHAPGVNRVVDSDRPS
jgi:hypothetical protein